MCVTKFLREKARSMGPTEKLTIDREWIEALEAYADGGAAAAREVLAAANASDEGAPLETVTREKCGDGYDVTVRLRPDMIAAQVEEAEKALRQALDDLATIPRSAEEGQSTD